MSDSEDSEELDKETIGKRVSKMTEEGSTLSNRNKGKLLVDC